MERVIKGRGGQGSEWTDAGLSPDCIALLCIERGLVPGCDAGTGGGEF